MREKGHPTSVGAGGTGHSTVVADHDVPSPCGGGCARLSGPTSAGAGGFPVRLRRQRTDRGRAVLRAEAEGDARPAHRHVPLPNDRSECEDFRKTVQRFSGENLDANLKMVEELRALAADRGVTAGQPW